jgi:hypothetical protein
VTAADPRIEAVRNADGNFIERTDDPHDVEERRWARLLLRAADAADREAGIVRVDTNDEVLAGAIERLHYRVNVMKWGGATYAPADVRAVLAALREEATP